MYYFRENLKNRRAVKVTVPHKKVMMCLNESNLNPMKVLNKEIMQKISSFPINRYFNDVTDELKQLLSDYIGFSEDYFIFGNGADEMLYYLFNAVRNNDDSFALSLSPSYFDYKSYSGAVGLNIKFIHLDSNFDFDVDNYISAGKDPNCKLTIICNPNNPTGNLFSKEKIEKIINETDHLVMIDETYFEFSKITFANLIHKYNNLVIIRSFSKSFSIAGLRFGYMISNPANINEIKKVKTVFNLNLLTQAIVSILIKNRDIFAKHIAKVISERKILYHELKKIEQIKIWDSSTNFLIFNAGNKSKALFQYLQDNEIAIRDVGHHAVMKNNLRVSIGSKMENNLFINKVKDFFYKK